MACTGDSSDGYDCNQYSLGKFTIKAVITTNDFGAAIDPSQFTGDTDFDISLGDYSYSDTLSDASVDTNKKIEFLVPFQACDINGNNCKTINETITLSWTTKELTISISAPTGSDANGDTFENAIDADNFDGNDTGSYPDTISFEMDLGSLSVYSDVVPVLAEVATKDVTDKSGDDDTLSNVSIKETVPATDLGQ
ncbi:MAG: hypothetical protein ABSA12_15195 [Verrucomicrobiia bacterium]